METYDSK